MPTANSIVFCRWHYWLARVDRVPQNVDPGSGSLRSGIACADAPKSPRRKQVDLARDGRRVRPRGSTRASDVPLVFLWATGGYEAEGVSPDRMTLLLSSDLLQRGAEGGQPTRDWRRLVPRLETAELTGRHLECITDHVGGLAQTIRRCLEPGGE